MAPKSAMRHAKAKAAATPVRHPIEAQNVVDNRDERSRSPRARRQNTTPQTNSVDWNVRGAITNGTAADYKLHVIQLHGDRMEAILKQFEEHWFRWGPTAAIFTDVGRARDFAAKMCQMRCSTEVLTADTPAEERERMCERLARWELVAVACVACSINAAGVHTVFVCDEQVNPTCAIEMMRYASQHTPTKPYFRVNLICREPDDVAPILRLIADGDPYIRRSARAVLEGRGPVDSRISIAHALQSRDPDDGVECSETFLPRLVEILAARSQQQRRVRRSCA